MEVTSKEVNRLIVLLLIKKKKIRGRRKTTTEEEKKYLDSGLSVNKSFCFL